VNRRSLYSVSLCVRSLAAIALATAAVSVVDSWVFSSDSPSLEVAIPTAVPQQSYPRLHGFSPHDEETLRDALKARPYAGRVLVIGVARSPSDNLFATVQLLCGDAREDRWLTRGEMAAMAADALSTAFEAIQPLVRVDVWAVPLHGQPAGVERSRDVVFSLSCGRENWRRLLRGPAGRGESELAAACGAVFYAPAFAAQTSAAASAGTPESVSVTATPQ